MRRGGCAVKKKDAKRPLRAAGVVVINHRAFIYQHHLGRSKYVAARHLLMSRPPLLSWGGEFLIGCFATFVFVNWGCAPSRMRFANPTSDLRIFPDSS